MVVERLFWMVVERLFYILDAFGIMPFGMFVYNDFTSSDTRYELFGANSTALIFRRKLLVSLTRNFSDNRLKVIVNMF